jgi:hypothetical protein
MKPQITRMITDEIPNAKMPNGDVIEKGAPGSGILPPGLYHRLPPFLNLGFDVWILSPVVPASK